ncbi:hypothetical protein LLT7_12915 [Lactococcus cremoris subsp. cremoris TIFN7]|nr:hypothetical protein LLT7_12915 [Lactococcus cremoris subsp. cremoris TIFN7]
MKFLMVLKLLAILPSGSAGKFLKKFGIWKMGGTRPPLCGNLVIWSKCPLAQ